MQEAAEHGVDSIFAIAHRQGLSSALYSAKEKFSLFQRSWPSGTNKVLIDANNQRPRRRRPSATSSDESFDFAFLHISLPDRAGHAHGWLSERYLTAVRRSDELVGDVVATIRADARLADRVTVILTADHGGPRGERNHIEADRLANYRVPFLMWGTGVARGADLYDLSPNLADPGTRAGRVRRRAAAGPQRLRRQRGRRDPQDPDRAREPARRRQPAQLALTRPASPRELPPRDAFTGASPTETSLSVAPRRRCCTRRDRPARRERLDRRREPPPDRWVQRGSAFGVLARCVRLVTSRSRHK